MMVTFVRGHVPDVHGSLEFDPADPGSLGVKVNKVRRCAPVVLAVSSIDCREFGISWNGDLVRCGSVVGNTVQITIDAAAIQD